MVFSVIFGQSHSVRDCIWVQELGELEVSWNKPDSVKLQIPSSVIEVAPQKFKE